jgi:hypothetical protein
MTNSENNDGRFLGDLRSPYVIFAKGFLFLLLGTFAAVLLLLLSPSWTVAALLAIAIWAFCRFYYFTFYVIEHYVDPQYKFAGLIAFVRYLRRKR